MASLSASSSNNRAVANEVTYSVTTSTQDPLATNTAALGFVYTHVVDKVMRALGGSVTGLTAQSLEDVIASVSNGVMKITFDVNGIFSVDVFNVIKSELKSMNPSIQLDTSSGSRFNVRIDTAKAFSVVRQTLHNDAAAAALTEAEAKHSQTLVSRLLLLGFVLVCLVLWFKVPFAEKVRLLDKYLPYLHRIFEQVVSAGRSMSGSGGGGGK